MSAEVRESGLVEGADGEIATWVTLEDPSESGGTGDSGRYAVMEPVARAHSSFGEHPPEVEITDEGALASRYCTSKLRDDRWLEELSRFA